MRLYFKISLSPLRYLTQGKFLTAYYVVLAQFLTALTKTT